MSKVVLTGSVGDRSRNGVRAQNEPRDVILVQELLRGHKMYGGRIDGDSGAQTIAAIRLFQQRYLGPKKPDGRVDVGGNTWRKLVTQKRFSRPFRVLFPGRFRRVSEGVSIDGILMLRTQAFCHCLIDNDLVSGNIVYTSGVRGPKTAHRWSTAWSIRMRRVPLQNLLDLKDGKDADGTLWYEAGWEKSLARDSNNRLTKASEAALWKKIIANAEKQWSGKIAAEGYSRTDPRIKPNVHGNKSNHVDGNAVDISIPWRPGARVPLEFGGKRIIDGKNTDAAANGVVRAFGLCRPVRSEMWHFQILRNEWKEFSRDYLDFYVV